MVSRGPPLLMISDYMAVAASVCDGAGASTGLRESTEGSLMDCQVKLVLFDLDGTIIDTMGHYARIASKLIAETLQSITPKEALERYLETSGRSFRDQLRLIGVPEDKVEELAARFEEEKKRLLQSVKPNPLVVERIKRLRRAGLKTALSTNNECSVVERLDWLSTLFDVILCHDPARGDGKGDPHLRRLLEKGYRRCEIVFVGDSDYDLETYQRLGIRVLRTQGLWRRDDRVIEEILGQLRARGTPKTLTEYEAESVEGPSRPGRIPLL